MTRNIITIHAGISIFAKTYAGPSKTVKLIVEQAQNKTNIANLDLIFSKFMGEPGTVWFLKIPEGRVLLIIYCISNSRYLLHELSLFWQGMFFEMTHGCKSNSKRS